MGKYQIDLMDGYDGRECVYDEKKEKRYHATVWICIMVCMILVLIRGALWHAQEIDMILHYRMLDAVYNEQTGYAYYVDDAGRQRQCSLDGYDAQIKDGKVTLYYKDDLSEVHPVNSVWFWLRIYLFLGGVTAICCWRIMKIYTKKSHSAETGRTL